jgi:predicted DNA-binding protein with PD1-like motif
MQSIENNNIIFLRLFSDEDIHNKLKEVCSLYNVKTAVILSGVGQLKNFKLGYFKGRDNYVPEKFMIPYELLSLSGNICNYNGDYDIHLHAVLGDLNKNTIGGHLLEGEVEVTNEIVLLKTFLNISRRFEDKTGLKGIYIDG